MNELKEILETVSSPIISACAIFAVKILYELKQEINHLNTKIAVIVERVDSHEKRITRIEDGA